MAVLKADPLGGRSIDTVKLSDAKEWAIRMGEKGYAYKTINNWKRSLKAAFYTAIEDDCIRKNPFNFALDTIRSTGSIVTRSSSFWEQASVSPNSAA